MRFLKPIDEDILTEASRCKRIITVEDGVRNGGLGSAVVEWLSDHGLNTPVCRMGLPDAFIEHGTVAELRDITGIDKQHIKNEIVRLQSIK